MKRRQFLAATGVTGMAYTIPSTSEFMTTKEEKEIYEIRVYHLLGGGHKRQLQTYMERALIPFLNKHDVTVGAFGEYSEEEPPKVYTLFAYPNFEVYRATQAALLNDSNYLESAKPFLSLPPEKKFYERYETFLTEAFGGLPKMKQPNRGHSLLELRIYESYNEDAGQRKIRMFDNEELPLFEKVGLHPVFFSKILAGEYMPALCYMLWFEDMDEREKNWDLFLRSAEWNEMKNKEIYKDTVSKVRKIFLTPLPYSQV